MTVKLPTVLMIFLVISSASFAAPVFESDFKLIVRDSDNRGYTALHARDLNFLENELKGRGNPGDVQEAGKKGGDSDKIRHGPTFYETIGRKGGEATKERHRSEFYEAIGKKDGEATRERHGSESHEGKGNKRRDNYEFYETIT